MDTERKFGIVYGNWHRDKNGYYTEFFFRNFQPSISATDLPLLAYNMCHNVMTSERDISSELLVGHTASANKKA